MTSTIPRWLMAAETALIIAAPYVYMQMPHEISSDGYLRLETTRYLALGQVIDQPVPLLFSVLALPLYHFGDVVALFNMVTLFAALAVLAALFWKDVPAALIRRFVLIVLAASMFPHHTQVFFGELLTALFIAIGIALMVTGWALPGTAGAILGVVNQPASAPALLLMLLDRARPPYRLVKAAWPLAVCAALLMLEFYLRRGSPFASGYEGDFGAKSVMPYSGRPGFSYPLVFGLLSILFSFGKGLAFFVPGLWLLFKRPVMQVPDILRRYQRHAVWFVAGLVLVYAKWWAWPGGWFWGPRFFVFACIPHRSRGDSPLRRARDTRSQGADDRTPGMVDVGRHQRRVYGQLDMSMCNTEPSIEPCAGTPEYSALFRPFIVAKTLSFKG